jgi:hypothetical protein
MRLWRPAIAIAALASAFSPAVARADFFAAVNVAAPAPRTDFDIAVLNASTGARVTLPIGTNTPADELHPDITPGGKRLTFERVDRAAGTTRIIAVDLSTNQSADLFDGFDAATTKPVDPTITPDGQTVATGGPVTSPNSFVQRSLTLTSLANFPTGPFPHSVLKSRSSTGGGNSMSITNPDAGGHGWFILTSRVPGSRSVVTLLDSGGRDSTPPFDDGAKNDNRGALAANNLKLALIQGASAGDNGTGDIFFSPPNLAIPIFGPVTALPAIVNSPLDESQPALSADGRYVAFVRHGSDSHDRLFLWDSQTQLLLNAAGVDLGAVSTRDDGNVGLYQRTLFVSTAVTSLGTVKFQLAQPAGVGILVQRIRGRKRILGRKAYKLGPAMRVPLGKFKKGRRRTHWNFKVNGKRLPLGRYLVTLRAVTPDVIVRELGKPRVLTIKKKKTKKRR